MQLANHVSHALGIPCYQYDSNGYFGCSFSGTDCSLGRVINHFSHCSHGLNILRKKAKVTIAALFVLLSLATAVGYVQIGILPTPTNHTPTSTPSSTPEPKPLGIEVKVTPWGDMYRKEPDCKEDFSVELVCPKQNENLTTNNFNITFNAGAFFWVIEKAYYTSDMFSGERWIEITKNQYTLDLQKIFLFDLTNVPNGNHYLTLTVIFHEGTRNNATALFNVST